MKESEPKHLGPKRFNEFDMFRYLRLPNMGIDESERKLSLLKKGRFDRFQKDFQAYLDNREMESQMKLKILHQQEGL